MCIDTHPLSVASDRPTSRVLDRIGTAIDSLKSIAGNLNIDNALNRLRPLLRLADDDEKPDSLEEPTYSEALARFSKIDDRSAEIAQKITALAKLYRPVFAETAFHAATEASIRETRALQLARHIDLPDSTTPTTSAKHAR